MRRLLLMFKITFLATLTVCLVSCSDNDDEPELKPEYLRGAFITCEGNYDANNGTISFLDADSSKITNALFKSVNNRGLGDIVQSFSVINDKGYIVVNNSQKVEVVNMETFESLETITGFDYPRYFLQVDEKRGYLTNGSIEGKVYVIDLETHAIVDSVSVGNGPENLEKVGDNVFVANSGGWSTDNTISVITTANGKNEVIKTITVSDVPVVLKTDANGNLWAYCKGLNSWSGGPTNAKLVKIDLASLSVMQEFDIGDPQPGLGTRLMTISPDGKFIYFENGGIFKVDVNATQLASELLVTAPNGSFYGVAVNPSNGDVFGLEQDWEGGSGKVYQYSSNGTLLNEYEVGIGPNSIVFY